MENSSNYGRQPLVRQTPLKQKPAQKQVSPKVKKHRFPRTKWNFIDLTMATLTLLVAVVGMLMVINISNQGSRADAHLNKITTELAQVRNDNNDLKQEIGSATSNDRLAQVARDSDISMNSANVRNVK